MDTSNITKVNVNIGLYIVGLAAFGAAEKWQLWGLKDYAEWTIWVAGVSVAVCLVPYTRRYFIQKWYKDGNRKKSNQLECKTVTRTVTTTSTSTSEEKN